MARQKRPERKAAIPGEWLPDTNLAEVIHFASEKFPTFLLLFAAGARAKNNQHMIEDIRLLRGVVSRMDAWRRMKARQWAKQEQPQTQPETINT